MGTSISTMKCPVCEDRLLETLSTPFGTWERCPQCAGILISQDLLASASASPANCKTALEETRDLLLPADRTCPKCLQKLFDGRVESRHVIFSLCTTDDVLWTNLPTLHQFEEVIEKKLIAETEASGAGKAAAPNLAAGRFYEDSGMSRFFRLFARMFDSVADSFRNNPEEEELLKEAKELKKKKPKKEEKKSKIIQAVEPAPPPQKVKAVTKPAEPVEEKEAEAPKIEIPEFIFPEEKEKPTPEPEPVKAPEPAKEPEPVKPPEPEIKMPEPIQYIEPPKSSGVPQGPAVFYTKPQTPSEPEPVPKPTEKKPILSGSAPKPGFFAALKAAWSPKPKKTTPTAAKPKPQPKPEAKPESKPAPVPKPEPVKEPPKPKPVPAPKPVKPAPVPKPKKERPPKDPSDLAAILPPWLLAAAGMLLSGLRDYGYEGMPALLWGVMGWSVGLMVRQFRLYPSGIFPEANLQALSEYKGAKAIPVQLKGEVVPEKAENPKGKVHFVQESRTIALNKMGRWDVIPRLFGLSNPNQILKGYVTITGWYRPALSPSIEIQEVRSEKSVRKSMTKALRWVFPMILFAAALVFYLSLD